MTSEGVKSELEKSPFVPLRVHLVSGKTVEIVMPGIAWMLQNALFVLHDVCGTRDETYDVISSRNIGTARANYRGYRPWQPILKGSPMLKEAVRAELNREPFVPLRIHLQNGKHYDVPFRQVAHMLGYGVLVLIGLKQGSVQAKGYDRFPFDHITRIEKLSTGGSSRRRRKAS